jgi:hypothetical protein
MQTMMWPFGIDKARKAIFALMSEINGSLVMGVKSVEYLVPELNNTLAATVC